MSLSKVTVYSVIKRFRERGKVERRLSDRGPKMQPKALQILAYITDDQRLQDWGRFTCKERAALIEEELGLQVHPHVLRKLYIKANIRYRRVKLEPLCKDYDTIDVRR